MAAFKDALHTGFSQALEELNYPRTRERLPLRSKGLVRRSKLEVDQRYRDWLLQ
jgi:hypothetical protein